MSDCIDTELDQLRAQAVQLKDQVERGLEDGDPNVFDMLKKKMQYLRGKIDGKGAGGYQRLRERVFSLAALWLPQAATP